MDERTRIAVDLVDALQDYGVTLEMLDNVMSRRTRMAGVADAIFMTYGNAADIEKTLTPVDKSSLNQRTVTILKRHGIFYLEELTTVTRDDFLAIRNVGPLTAEVLEHALAERSISFRLPTMPRRTALEVIYGSLANVPLRLVVTIWDDWEEDYGKFKRASIESVSDLLKYSRKELARVKEHGLHPVFRREHIAQIEEALSKVGLYLRRE